jgi:hypothetical protein
MRLQESRGQPRSSPSNPQHPHLGQVIRVNRGLQIVLALFSYSCPTKTCGVVYKSALHKCVRKLDAGHERSSTRTGKEQHGSPGFPTLCSERFPPDQAVDVRSGVRAWALQWSLSHSLHCSVSLSMLCRDDVKPASSARSVNGSRPTPSRSGFSEVSPCDTPCGECAFTYPLAI